MTAMYGGERRGERFLFSLAELSGATGDLGTLLPLMLGAIWIGGLTPLPVLAGFAVFYLATAAVYRLPVPVQPMKAVAAVLVTAEVSGASLAAAGAMIGAVLLVLGLTGWISRIARLVPQSVLAGLQLGLGLALGLVGLELMASAPVMGVGLLALLACLMAVPRAPAALIALGAAAGLGAAFGLPGIGGAEAPAAFALPGLPGLGELERAASQLVLPQLSLTVMNAVVLTALVAGDYFGERAAHVTPARLAVTSGLANLVLAPFGALPMCHGAGGLAAHHRFGARSGTAPAILGLVLLAAALAPGGIGLAALAAIPAAGLGALLVVAAGELALTRRLFDCRASCWPVIAVAAGVTLAVDPFWGLVAGSAGELVRVGAVRAVMGRREAR